MHIRFNSKNKKNSEKVIFFWKDILIKSNLGRNLHVCAGQPASVQDSGAAAQGCGGLQTRRVHDCQGN